MNIPATAALVLGIVVGLLLFVNGCLIIALGAPTSGPAIPLAVLRMFFGLPAFFPVWRSWYSMHSGIGKNRSCRIAGSVCRQKIPRFSQRQGRVVDLNCNPSRQFKNNEPSVLDLLQARFLKLSPLIGRFFFLHFKNEDLDGINMWC